MVFEVVYVNVNKIRVFYTTFVNSPPNKLTVQRTFNQRVLGSSPSGLTKYHPLHHVMPNVRSGARASGQPGDRTFSPFSIPLPPLLTSRLHGDDLAEELSVRHPT